MAEDLHRLRISVLGAGTMGSGIATASLRAGLTTVLADVDEAVLAAAGEAIRRRLERELGASEGTDRVRLLRMTTDLDESVEAADAVIEAVPELVELKKEIFGRLGTLTPPGALLATNTSTMSVGLLADACTRPDRVIGMHFFNPAHRMPLVEIVKGAASSAATVDDAVALARLLGKEPIVVADVPGFVTSRIGLLVGNEAMRLVEEGVASAADVDKAMRLGYGHPMGPLELADLVGLDARLNNVRSMFAQVGSEPYRPPALLERLVVAGHLGKKSGQGFYRYDAQGTLLGPVESYPA